jgi:beta-glucosidase
MPGPPKWRTPTLINQLLSCKKLTEEVLTDRATQVLNTVQKLARLSPEQVYSDGKEHTRELPEHHKAFCRQIAADGIVLLKNEKHVLPLVPPTNGSSKLKVAVIGQHAKTTAISGGGSAALKPTYVATPWKGLNDAVPNGVELSYTVGCYGTFSL